MKKLSLAVTAVIAAGSLALTGCGGNSGEVSSDTIVVDMWAGSQSDTEALEKQMTIAGDANPELELELRQAPWNDFFTKLTSNMASGSMACITGMNSGELVTYADGFMELTPEDLEIAGLSEEDFAEGSWDSLTYEGALYAIPFDVSTMLTYYNADMFEAAGVPAPEAGWSFEDFEAAAKATTTGGKYGFGIGLGGFQWQALPIAKSGTQPITDSGELALADSEFTEAASWYSGLVTEQKVAAPAGSAADTGWGENQYSAGNAAMAVDGTWNAVSYLGNDAGFKAGLAPLPTGENGSLSLVLTSGYGIAKNCENKEAALKVLGSLLGEDSQDYIASSGRSYPARISSQPLYFEALDPAIRDEVETAFQSAFKDVEGQNVTDNWSQVGTWIQPRLVSAYNGQESMESVLEQAQNQFGQ